MTEVRFGVGLSVVDRRARVWEASERSRPRMRWVSLSLPSSHLVSVEGRIPWIWLLRDAGGLPGSCLPPSSLQRSSLSSPVKNTINLAITVAGWSRRSSLLGSSSLRTTSWNARKWRPQSRPPFLPLAVSGPLLIGPATTTTTSLAVTSNGIWGLTVAAEEEGRGEAYQPKHVVSLSCVSSDIQIRLRTISPTTKCKLSSFRSDKNSDVTYLHTCYPASPTVRDRSREIRAVAHSRSESEAETGRFIQFVLGGTLVLSGVLNIKRHCSRYDNWLILQNITK